MLDLRLLFVALAWGINFSVIKSALADFLPLSFTVARFTLASLSLFAVMIARRISFTVARRDWLPLAALGLVGITLYNLLFMKGLQLTTASHSALFISLSPLFAALLQTLRGRERLTGSLATGLLVATAGAYCIILSTHGGIHFGTATVTGDLLTIAASVLWALYTVLAAPLLTRYPPLTVTAWSVAAGTVLLLPSSADELRSQSWSAVPVASWAALAFAALVGAGAAYVLWYDGVKRIGATRTIAYHYIVPFVAVLTASLFLGDAIRPLTIIGGVAILAGVALVQRRTSEKKTTGDGRT
jgi:drug/metabolite transporter (DMT)-like permease